MKKTIITVFGIIGVLLLCLLVWSLVFGGGIQQAYNAVASTINETWHNITGSDDDILTSWAEDDTNNLADGQGLIS